MADLLPNLIERLHDVLLNEERRRVPALGLSTSQQRALTYLGRCNRYSNNPSAVGEYLGLTRGTTSQTLLRLEDKGLLLRRRDAGDRRKIRLELTKKGRQTAHKLASSGALRRAIADAPPDLEEALFSFLRRLQEENRLRTFGVCRTCRFFQPRGSGRHGKCGLTHEILHVSDASKICHEHEVAAS